MRCGRVTFTVLESSLVTSTQGGGGSKTPYDIKTTLYYPYDISESVFNKFGVI